MKLIPLTRGEFAQVDDEDFERVNRLRWRLCNMHGMRYVARTDVRRGRKNTTYLHRFILPDICQHIDHADGNGLNNQKFNLRAASRSENMANRRMQRNNTTGFKGVTFHKPTRRYIAAIRYNNKLNHLGCFADPREAAIVYDAAAIERVGKFARTNKMMGVL